MNASATRDPAGSPTIRASYSAGAGENVERPNLLLEKIKDLRLARLKRYWENFSLANLRWQWRFYSGDPDPAWYRSLFQAAGQRVTGVLGVNSDLMSASGFQFGFHQTRTRIGLQKTKLRFGRFSFRINHIIWLD